MFVCPYSNCGKSFLTASGLRKHRQSHEDHEHQYVCEMCKDTKVFKTKEVGGVWIVSFTGPEPSHQKQALVATTLHLHRARVTAVERGES